MIRATIDLKTNTLEHDSVQYPMDGEGMSKLRQLIALEDPDTEVCLVDVAVYQAGWNRNGLETHPDDLAEYVASMEKDHPIFEMHTHQRRLGYGNNGRLDESVTPAVIRQDIHYTTPKGLAILAAGGGARYSVGRAMTKETRLMCSVCQQEWYTGDCDHYFGDVGEDGEEFRLQATHLLHNETSHLHRPACTGTGIDDPALVASTIGPANLATEDLLNLQAVRHQAKMTAKVTAMQADIDASRTDVSRLTGELEELRQRLVTVETEREKLEAAEALRYVRQVRKKKGLRGAEGPLVAQYRDNPEGFKLLVEAMPDSDIAEILTGAELGAPANLLDDQEEESTQHQRRYQRCLEISARTGVSIDKVWAQERNREVGR